MRLLIAALRRVIAESYQIGTVYDYDAVVKSAQRFGNPDIVSHGSGSLFSSLFKPDQKFVLREVDINKLEAGDSKKEYPNEVMWLENGPEYDDDGKLVGGDEFYAQRFADKYQTGTSADPIIVKPAGSRFRIIDGRHRARAAFLRGEKRIRAFVAQD
jgi:hypothetical protein